MKKLSYSIIVMSLLISHANHASYWPTWLTLSWSKKPVATQAQNEKMQKFEKVLSNFQKISSMTDVSEEQDSILYNLHQNVLTRISSQTSYKDQILSDAPECKSICDQFLSQNTDLLIEQILLYKNEQDLNILRKAQQSVSNIPGALLCLVTPRSYSTFGTGLLSGFLVYGFLSAQRKENSSFVAAALLAGVSSGFILHKLFKSSHDMKTTLNQTSRDLNSAHSTIQVLCKQLSMGQQLGNVESGLVTLQSVAIEHGTSLDQIKDRQQVNTDQLIAIATDVGQVKNQLDRQEERIESIAVSQEDQKVILERFDDRLSRLTDLFTQFQKQLQQFSIQLQVDREKFNQYLLAGTAEVEFLKEELISGLDSTQKLIIISMLENQKQAFQTQQMIADASQRKSLPRPHSYNSLPIAGLYQKPFMILSGTSSFERDYGAGNNFSSRPLTEKDILLLTSDAHKSKTGVQSKKRPKSRLQITDGSETK